MAAARCVALNPVRTARLVERAWAWPFQRWRASVRPRRRARAGEPLISPGAALRRPPRHGRGPLRATFSRTGEGVAAAGVRRINRPIQASRAPPLPRAASTIASRKRPSIASLAVGSGEARKIFAISSPVIYAPVTLLLSTRSVSHSSCYFAQLLPFALRALRRRDRLSTVPDVVSARDRRQRRRPSAGDRRVRVPRAGRGEAAPPLGA